MSDRRDDDLSLLIAGLEEASAVSARLGCIAALEHVLYFLAKKGFSPEQLFPLFMLATGLVDLESGKNSQIFERSKRKVSNQRGRLLDELGKTWAAVALELFISAGVPKKEAAIAVYRKITHLGIGGYKTKPKTICSWRDRIKRGKRSNPQTGAFCAWIRRVRTHNQDIPMAVAKRFLGSPPALHPTKARLSMKNRSIKKKSS